MGNLDVRETEKLSKKWGSWLQKEMFAISRAPYFQIFFPSRRILNPIGKLYYADDSYTVL
jgi:hypothetical protein